MTHVSRKLRTPLQGALAGGGDPATSPLYVFGPFLRLIVAAGVAEVTFGASIWLVIITIAVVSAMYRLVMTWVTDGSGGSGLSEEEFGAWAVKINASITFIEYTLTFLVSMAALVTFVADRLPALNDSYVFIENRAWLAIVLSVMTGWLVNRGPTVAARTFGPATAAVLVLLWVMMVSTIVTRGFELPSIDFRAFTPTYWTETFGGFARILAVMTGIEIFANLVAAFDGPVEERGRKAFHGLVIIMGTTGLTMLIVGPAILAIADPFNEEVSVFTQTMDELLPGVLSEIGTIVGVAVLLSAAAASALGLQNLFVGLGMRHYVPRQMTRINRFGVAPRPVWVEVGIASLAFLLLGTDEETYLALYAAGVFILLAMTGWAATKRLVRERADSQAARSLLLTAGTVVAAVLTTGATLIIFVERFGDGAWIYFVLVPLLYGAFGYIRKELGPPPSFSESLAAMVSGGRVTTAGETVWNAETDHSIRSILTPVERTDHAVNAVPLASNVANLFAASHSIVNVGDPSAPSLLEGWHVETVPAHGSVASTLEAIATTREVDLIVMSTGGGGRGLRHLGAVTEATIRGARCPVLLVPRVGLPEPTFTPMRIVVGLDGSLEAERAIPLATQFAVRFSCEIVLTRITTEVDRDGAEIQEYLAMVAARVQTVGVSIRTEVHDGNPDDVLTSFGTVESATMLLLATHGRGGLSRVVVGSVAESVVRRSTVPVVLVPIGERRPS